MTLIKLPNPPVKLASVSSDFDFSCSESPSAKFNLNISAFNGNTTNFGSRCGK